MQFFEVEVIAVQRLSPSFIRISFKGGRVKTMRMFAPDQWIKLYIPNLDGSVLKITSNAQYMALPKDTRPSVRTYTIKDLRPEQNEFDVDFVAHGDEGPASRWALLAKVGDKIQIRAHCVSQDNKPAGCRWLPPQNAKQFIIFADETALPATRGILEQLSKQQQPPDMQVFIETPGKEDCLVMPAWEGLNLKYLPRDNRQKHGSRLIEEAMNIAIVGDKEDFFIWLGAETKAVRSIRLHLTKTHGLKKTVIGFVNYWKYGEKQF